MTCGCQHLAYRQLQAPRENGAVLVDPPWERVGELIARNRELAALRCHDVQGRCLSDLAAEARRQLLADAVRWTSAYRDVDGASLDPAGPILLAGHQPQIFHPGVWFKNFALGALAQRHAATAVNLLIDSDTIKTNTLRVPSGSPAAPRVSAVPFDLIGRSVPYEERRVLDRTLFASFGRRVSEQIAPLVSNPLIDEYWPRAVARLGETDRLGYCLAQSRHQLEGAWGLQTLEIPQSLVCSTAACGWFVCHLLANLARFRQSYNDVVGEYRRAHRIRSAAHPVPDLARQGEWLEAPYWIWTADDPRRRRLFVRPGRGELTLTDRGNLRLSLPLSPQGDAARAVECLQDFARRGIKIRSRALITTLWARLVLGDLFLHGIGGAKYDQVTDALCTRFFGLKPPDFLVLSATLHLPIPHRPTTADDVRLIRRRLRELTFHPECYLDGSASMDDRRRDELVAAKRRWIQTEPSRANARARFLGIRRINSDLQPWVSGQRERLSAELDQATQARQTEEILSSREYGFCLFPEDRIRGQLL